MKVRIEIDTKTFVRFWLVVISFAAVILFVYYARTALTIIGTAVFLALALNVPVTILARRLPGGSRTLSTAISFILIILLLAMMVFLVIPAIAEQTVKFIESLPQLLQSLSSQWSGLGVLVEKYNIQPQVDQAVLSIQQNATGAVASFGGNFLNVLGSAFSVFAASLLTLVLTFLMLVEGPTWMKRVWGLYSDKVRMEHHRHVLRRMHQVVSGYVTGQLTVSGIGSLCAGATVFILSMFIDEVPANLALPTIAIAFVFSLIPMFGATIAGVIISLLLALNSVPAGIIFAIYFMVYQQIENNFISPTIQSRRIELSPLAVLSAVTIGLYVFGIAGGIISIPIAGCIKVLVEEYLARKRHKHDEEQKPLAKLVRKLQGEESS